MKMSFVLVTMSTNPKRGTAKKSISFATPSTNWPQVKDIILLGIGIRWY